VPNQSKDKKNYESEQKTGEIAQKLPTSAVK
jgi:hypothetical protein